MVGGDRSHSCNTFVIHWMPDWESLKVNGIKSYSFLSHYLMLWSPNNIELGEGNLNKGKVNRLHICNDFKYDNSSGH